MDQYIFILGREPELSLLELYAYFKRKGISYKTLEENETLAIIELPSINAKNTIKDLGGTQKIAKIITSLDGLYKGKANKIRYAVSNYTPEKNESMQPEVKQYFKDLKVKATIKKPGNKQTFLDPSEAQDVIEIIQFKEIVAKTLAVFNPKEVKSRDLNRPYAKIQYPISIRIAKILINLSEAKDKQTLVDPFCGIGTILQEAMLMKIPVLGFESEDKLIKATIKNLEWTKNLYNTKTRFDIKKGKFKGFASRTTKNSVLVTKPYMGPQQKNYPTIGEAKKTIRKLLPQYDTLLREISKGISGNSVLLAPRYKTKAKQDIALSLTELLRDNKLKGEMVHTTNVRGKMLFDIWVIKR